MSDFDFDINDDLAVGEDYTGQQPGNKPPLPGNYQFKPEKWNYKTGKDGKPVLYKDRNGNPTYPVLSLVMAEISDPMEYGRRVALFQDVASNPFDRNGQVASQAADLLKALDPSATASNTGEVLAKVADALNAGQPFKARLDYSAYDKAAAAANVALLGSNPTPKQKAEAYRKAEIRGWRNIKNSNVKAGKPELPITKWVGPSGTVVDVRPVLTVFYPGTEDVTLGPDKGVVQ